jgi:YVTN family beta-propeller protein
MTAASPRRHRHAVLVGLVVALTTAGGCGAESDDGDSADAAPATTSAAAPTGLPEAEDVSSLDALTFTARPFPDFALTVDDVVWISGIDPGIVGYDAQTGEERATVETSDVYLAMEAGHGALWAAEASDGQYPDTLLRIDPASGTVTHRVPAPEPGLKPESSLAVTEDAVWGLIGQYEDPSDRALASFDPATGKVLDTVPAPPGANSVRGGHGSLWVSTGGGSVVRLDPADGSEQATIGTGQGSGFLTVSEDAVWVLDAVDGTVSRIDPATDEVVATIDVSDGPISGGDIAAGDGSVWVRTTEELAVQIDAATNEVVRVLGPQAGSGSVAITDGAVWITAHDTFEVHRVPTD